MGETEKKQPVRTYIDGGFDLIHSGHYNAIRQAKAMSDILVVGVNSDADLLATKGPTIMNCAERTEVLRHCKFIDELVTDVQYVPTFEVLDQYNCQYYAHGDDPCYSADGVEVTQQFKEANRFKMFKRTEGVSTTDITGKLLALARLKKAESILDEKTAEARQNSPHNTDEETLSSIQLNFSAGE